MTTPAEQALQQLAGILDASQTSLQLRPERVSSSVLHDATYHFLLLSYAFWRHSRDRGGRRSVLAAWLKLLQFAAARPELVEDLEQWVQSQRKRQLHLEDWPRLPRGYLSDRTHDALIEYLEICSYLVRKGDDVVEAAGVHHLDAVAQLLIDQDLLSGERAIIDQFAGKHVTKKALGAR